MEALILSRFDPFYGPKIFLKAPKSLEDEIINEIPSLMELQTKGIFIHIFKKIKAANLFFKLPNEHARGGNESLMISIITDLKSNISLMLAHDLLESFARNLTNLEGIYLAFDNKVKDVQSDPIKLKEIEKYFFSYFESIKPALRTIRMAENRYQALFKAAKDAIVIINRKNGMIVDANLETEKLIEQSREEIIGLHALKLELFDEGLIDPSMIDYLIDNPPPIISRIKKSTGKKLYLEVSVNEIKLGDEHFIQYMFHDITDLQVIEEKLKDQVKKMDILNTIISIANHANNLRELLTDILDNSIELFDLKGCCIYLVEKAGKLARVKVHKGFPPYFIQQNNRLDITKNPYEIVFNKGVVLNNKNFPELLDQFFEGIEFSSAAVLPLFSKFEIIGAVFMIFNGNKILSSEEMELIISLGMELGTAIERIQNKEELRRSEIRNNILLNHIPFSIFKISKNGIFLDIKLDKNIKQIIEQTFTTTEFIGKNINDFLPKETAEETQNNIEKALKINKSIEMKFVLPINDNQIIFKSNIVPLENKEVLVFLQNLTRTW
ncbi:MAG: PAS domain S-box protein [Promethearchaeota archaeon]